MPPAFPPAVAWYLARTAARTPYRYYVPRVTFGDLAYHYRKPIAAITAASTVPFVTRRKHKKMPAPPEYRPRVGKRRRGGQIIYADGGSVANSSYRSKRARIVSRTRMDYDRKVFGKFKSWSRKLNSLMRAATYPIIDRYSNLSSTYDNGGVYGLGFVNHSVNTTSFAYPVYLFDLNSLPYGNENGTTRYSMPMMRLFRSGANYQFVYQGLRGFDTDGNNNRYDWQVEYRAENTNFPSVENAFLDWIDFRLMLNGPRKTHSKVTVQIVRFPDDDCQPEAYKTTDGSSASTTLPTGVVTTSYGPANQADNISEWNNMWQEVCAPLISNPLVARPVQTVQRMQILKSWTYMFQPRDTSEDGPTNGAGDVVACKYRYGVGKTFRYRKIPSTTGQVTAAEEDGPNDFGQVADAADFQLHARPKARLFLLIKAYTPSRATVADAVGEDDTSTTMRYVDYDFMASFDILVRRKWITTRA